MQTFKFDTFPRGKKMFVQLRVAQPTFLPQNQADPHRTFRTWASYPPQNLPKKSAEILKRKDRFPLPPFWGARMC